MTQTNKTNEFVLLNDPSWTFHILPEAFDASEFFLMWHYPIQKETKDQSFLSDYAMSSFFNVSRPKSIGYRHEDPKTFGLNEQAVRVWTRYSDESELISTRRIWVQLPDHKEGDLNQRINFYLKLNELGAGIV